MNTSYIHIIFYDIPCNNQKEIKAYQKFRHALLLEGFYQFQESIYIKGIKNKSVYTRINKDLKKISPNNANIRSLLIPNSYFNKMDNLSGEDSLCERILKNNNNIIEF